MTIQMDIFALTCVFIFVITAIRVVITLDEIDKTVKEIRDWGTHVKNIQ
jgi:hypothetical protein